MNKCICIAADDRHDSLCPAGDSRYPVPKDYRRLESLELIDLGDLAWTDLGDGKGEWQTINEDDDMIGNKADRLVCVIRFTQPD